MNISEKFCITFHCHSKLLFKISRWNRSPSWERTSSILCQRHRTCKCISNALKMSYSKPKTDIETAEDVIPTELWWDFEKNLLFSFYWNPLTNCIAEWKIIWYLPLILAIARWSGLRPIWFKKAPLGYNAYGNDYKIKTKTK